VFDALNFERGRCVLKKVFPMLDSLKEGGTAAGEPTAEALAEISPSAVARTEKLLHPAAVGEGVVRTWSTLGWRSPGEVRRCLDLFHAERFAVLLHARPVLSLLDAGVVAAGLHCGQLALVGGIPAVLQPELLVHANASSADIFRAVVIANRLAFQVERGACSQLVPVSAATAVAALRAMPEGFAGIVRARTRALLVRRIVNGVARLARLFSPFAKDDAGDLEAGTELPMNISIDPAAARDIHYFDSDLLLSAVTDAYAYERNNNQALRKILSSAGWATDRFMFGSVHQRVEW
jgi:hypothetical protein